MQKVSSACFEVYSCSCGKGGRRFDQMVASETNFGITMRHLAHSNNGWFAGFSDPGYHDWQVRNESGVYMLWEKHDYCAIHGLYHSKALYVGKGAVKARIWGHSKRKRFIQDEITYFTFILMENRIAKYIEQLIQECLPCLQPSTPSTYSPQTPRLGQNRR
jgi:hypothetical protein